MAFDPQKAVQSRLIFLTGDDASARLAAIDQLANAAGLEPDDMDRESFTADSKPPKEWVASASMYPFLAPRRFVVVRNALRTDFFRLYGNAKMTKNHPLPTEFRNLPETALLILVADDENASDSDRQKKLTNTQEKLKKAIQHAEGATIAFNQPTGDLTQFLQAHAAKYDKKLSPRACGRLTEMVSGKASAAFAEIDKLALYVGDAPEIREDDIKAVVTPDPEYNVYQLLDAVTAGQTAPSLKQLQNLTGKSSNVTTDFFRSVLPMLHRQVRLLWQARACIEASCTPQRPNPHAEAAFIPDLNIGKQKEWLQGRLMRSAKNLTFPKLTILLNLLVDADAKLKGQRPSSSTQEVVEQLVIQMSEACRRR